MRTAIALLPALDALLVALAFLSAYLMAFDVGRDAQFEVYRQQILPLLPVLIAARLAAFVQQGLYRSVARYAGVAELTLLVRATILGSVLFGAVGLALPMLGGWTDLPLPADPAGTKYRVPIRILLLESILSFLAVGSMRFGRRALAQRRPGDSAEARRVLVVGAGREGAELVHRMVSDPASEFAPAAIVDDDATLIGRRIHGVPVEGPIARLGALLDRERPTHLILAERRPAPERLRAIVEASRARRVVFRKLPDVGDLLVGAPLTPDALAPIDIEDLLGRGTVDLGEPEIDRYIAGSCVLVTGAGGSIGAELCRRAAGLGAARIVAVGRGENSLHDLRLSFEEARAAAGGGASGDSALEVVVGDVRDAAAMGRLVARVRPAAIFHAAAHKHVDLMERSPHEALVNNVEATLGLARLAAAAGVARFVFVSTDKAVRPSSIMGASKRLAERCVGAVARRVGDAGGATRLCAVRFGNVLGSRGSVVTVFRRQLARGGPLQVTDPEATRYFMTTREAGALVLRAGALGGNGVLYLLDMGEPVRIVDLARQMIALAGRTEAEVGLEFTGMRPGEKLREEPLADPASARRAATDHVFETDLEAPPEADVEGWIARLREIAARGDIAAFRAALRTIIPDATLADGADGDV